MTLRKSAFKRNGKTKKELEKDLKAKGRYVQPYVKCQVLHAKKCWICRKPFKNQLEKEIHHIKPVSCGGSSRRDNLACVHVGECHEEADRRAFNKYQPTRCSI
ncbi:HNH endonuclease [Thermodesulfobacteriota bacterium]